MSEIIKIISLTFFISIFAFVADAKPNPKAEKIKLAEEYFNIPEVKETYKWAFGTATSTHAGVISEMFGQCLSNGGERKIVGYMNDLFNFNKYRNFYVESYARSLSKRDLVLLNDFASTDTFKNYNRLERDLTERVMIQFEKYLIENQMEIFSNMMEIMDSYIKPECKEKFKKKEI